MGKQLQGIFLSYRMSNYLLPFHGHFFLCRIPSTRKAIFLLDVIVEPMDVETLVEVSYIPSGIFFISLTLANYLMVSVQIKQKVRQNYFNYLAIAF
jgi:hypothetical protein